jgi:Ca2+-binding RTX toxin-like protein
MAIRNGTSASEILYGTVEADQIYGLDGDDALHGRAGDDQLWGDEGDDVAFGGDGDDLVYGGPGDDRLHGDAGVDRVQGGDGNDVVKGGTGLSYLYGEAGDDILAYAPATGRVETIGTSLSATRLSGGDGTDTLQITNETTYGAAGRPSGTSIVNFDGVGEIVFGDIGGRSAATLVGLYDHVERIEVTGAARLFYDGYDVTGMTVVGTTGDDVFDGGDGNDTFIGGGGDDVMWGRAGDDRLESEADDADEFHFEPSSSGSDTVVGFNGAGAPGGDELHFHDIPSLAVANPTDASTAFTWTGDDGSVGGVTVDAAGLRPGQDYFLV